MLEVDNAQFASAGAYQVIVTNAFGRFASRFAVLGISAVQPGDAGGEEGGVLFLVQSVELSTGDVRVRFEQIQGPALTGGQAERLEVQGSPDFVNWRTVSSRLTPSAGGFEVVDADGAHEPCRFYRVISR